MRKPFQLLLLVATLAGGISLACSSNEEGKTVVEVKAQNVRFVPDVIEVPVGQTVTLRLKNLDATEHDLEVRGLTPVSVSGGGHDGHGAPIMLKKSIAVHTQANGTASVEFRADEKGTYEVVCTIPGHEEVGMVARLVVI